MKRRKITGIVSAATHYVGIPLTVTGGDVARLAARCMTLHGYVCTPNALMLEEARRSRAFADTLAHAVLLIPDGAGTALALRAEGHTVPRVTGVDLGMALAYLAAVTGTPLYLYGGRAGVARRAAMSLKTRFPGLRVVGVGDGYGDPEQAVTRIAASGAQIVFVCLGVPKQEYFMRDVLLPAAPGILAIGLGGAFDVYAGDVRRAPVIFRVTGTEWLYRSVTQPWRLARLPKLFSTGSIILRLLCTKTTKVTV